MFESSRRIRRTGAAAITAAAVLALCALSSASAQAAPWQCQATGLAYAYATGTVANRTSQWNINGTGSCTQTTVTQTLTSPVSISGYGTSQLGYCGIDDANTFIAAQLTLHVSVTAASGGPSASEQWYAPVAETNGVTSALSPNPFLVSGGATGLGLMQLYGFCSPNFVGQLVGGAPGSFGDYPSSTQPPNASVSWTQS